MTTIIETVNLISETMGKLLDFIVDDEYLGKEFEGYLERNKIEVQKQSQLNDILIGYILDGKTTDGVRVLDYFSEKNPEIEQNTIYALKNSFVSVFRVDKKYKNAYDCHCLINETDLNIMPLVKMMHLKGIGLCDFVKARVIEFNKEYFFLEIYDVMGQIREFDANVEVIKTIVKSPKNIFNPQRALELKQSVKSFESSFLEAFSTNEIVTTNKLADVLIHIFNEFHTGKTNEIPFKDLVKTPEEYKYFEIEEFNNDENFILNAVGGFSKHKDEYDVGLYVDPVSGLYIVPFLGTFNEILKQNSLEKIEGAKKCICNFLISEKITPGYLLAKSKEFKNLVDIINEATENDFKNIDEIISFYKSDCADFSSTILLYNSKAFSKVLGYEKQDNQAKEVGRNETCPCGSGQKYKRCCGKN